MAVDQGTVVFYNDGQKFVPAILMKDEGDGKERLYILQGSEQKAARRAPKDYGPEGGGVTWCTANELPG